VNAYNAFMRARLVFPLLLLAGCSTPVPMPPDQPGGWGKFTGPFNVELLEDGRKLRLLNDMTYTDPAGVAWLAPAGWVVDGATIPKEFWSSIGGPLEGQYRNASIFHDVACDKRERRWDEAAVMFYNAMRCGGVKERKAKLMFAAVYMYGPHWPAPGRTAARPQMQVPRRPTPAEVERLRKLIENENPSVEQIRAMKPEFAQ
jgi:hypothetical protein